MSDFFWGKDLHYVVQRRGLFKSEVVCKLPLDALLGMMSKVPGSYLRHQLERVLSNCPAGRLVMESIVTNPEFEPLLQILGPSNIGMIKLIRDESVNPGLHVPVCGLIYLKNGVVEFRTHWSTYNDAAVFHLVDTMLRPLFAHGLLGNTYIGSEQQPLLTGGYDPELMLRRVFRFAGYPAKGDAIISSQASRFTPDYMKTPVIWFHSYSADAESMMDGLPEHLLPDGLHVEERRYCDSESRLLSGIRVVDFNSDMHQLLTDVAKKAGTLAWVRPGCPEYTAQWYKTLGTSAGRSSNI